MSETQWVLLDVGCAECGDWPLVAPKGVYATAAGAAEVAGIERWKAHPQGGYISQSGSGAWWIAPMSSLSVVHDNEYMSEMGDSPREYVTP